MALKSSAKTGGRPRNALTPPLQLEDARRDIVQHSSSNRKSLSSAGKRDDTFGILAKIEVCELVEKRWPSFQKDGLSLSDLYAVVGKALGRDASKVKHAAEHKEQWTKERDRPQLGKGTKGTLRKQGKHLSFHLNFSMSRGLRREGGSTKAQLRVVPGNEKLV